ncbi:hypothetical protein [Paenibacillus sp. J2TS4]|uniref:hypothetical protein n=1 Tax=Paenibacillus sp. J2TS4 TaxID=2807194 RepID=UPI001BCE6E1E|nr:hypothetical protein [Paenibacillus sp. J2TS4]
MNKYGPENEKVYLKFWRKVEEKLIYKMVFALCLGLCGALFASLIAALVLISRGIDLQWTLLLIGIGFIIPIILSPIQYKRFSKRYHEHIQFHKNKNTDDFLKKLN